LRRQTPPLQQATLTEGAWGGRDPDRLPGLNDSQLTRSTHLPTPALAGRREEALRAVPRTKRLSGATWIQRLIPRAARRRESGFKRRSYIADQIQASASKASVFGRFIPLHTSLSTIFVYIFAIDIRSVPPWT